MKDSLDKKTYRDNWMDECVYVKDLKQTLKSLMLDFIDDDRISLKINLIILNKIINRFGELAKDEGGKA